jgi:ornithine decarboxylase antizyme 1
VGEIRNPSDPASYGLDPKKATLRLKFRVQNNYAPIAAAKNINKKFHNIEAEDENGNTMWEAVLWKGRLYVSVTANQLTGGSKEAFIMLLEYAEDVLDCSHVIVCLGKPNSFKGSTATYRNKNINTTNLEYEKESKMAIRNFLFLGFQPLAPGHEFNPSNPNLVCFVYTI